MPNPLVSIRLSPELLSASEKIARSEGYSSTQEFFREAIRTRIQEWRVRELTNLVGSAKDKKLRTFTRKERDALARQL